MYGIGVNKLGVINNVGGYVPSGPASLFASGEEGAWYDPSDLSTMFQNSDGTGAISVNGPVGYIADKSGNGNHAFQTTSAKRPTLRQDGSLYYLEFFGAQGLTTSAIDFTGTNEMTVFAGARKDLDTTVVVAELSPHVGQNNGAFRLASAITDAWRYTSKGTNTINVNTAADYAPPSLNVLTGISDIDDDVAKIRVDGVEKASSTSDQGNGPFGNWSLNIGARNNATSLFLDGRVYGLIVRGAESNAGEIASTEGYMTVKITTPPAPAPAPTSNLTLYSSNGLPWIDSDGVTVTNASAGFSVSEISTKLSSV